MHTVVLGTQWGDEGKAKVVDYFSGGFGLVARFQGGANAGHTVYTGGKKYVFHLVPSGILRPDVKVLVGNGVVLDPAEFLKEVEMVSRDVETEGRIFLSNRAQLVMPYHKLMDAAREKKSSNKIGTTLRGIGPAYEDKVTRLGIRVGDLYEANLKEKIKRGYERKLFMFEHYYKITDYPTVDEVYDEVSSFADKLKPYVADGERVLQKTIRSGESVLFEGAQGTLLDVDFGTYPFVTSSSTISGGLFTGTGAGYLSDMKVVGITKAYTTRVGEGPFPTEDDGSEGEALRKAGNEFGATTGRPRRCGWFDAVLTSYSMAVNGVTDIFLTKLDVLDGLEKIKVAVAYELDGKRLDYPPASTEALSRVKPVYEELPGWKEATQGVRKFEDLPNTARSYIKYLEDKVGVKVSYISTGFEREDVVVR